jgi:histidyl-tRNA synthetase
MIQTPKGFRDILPDDAQLYEKVTETIRDIYRSYGFRPMITPSVEFLNVLKAKSGDEIAGQIFKLDDEEAGLRFDLTVSLARVAANSTFPKPFKRYFVSTSWRKEEPQKGRFREFWQADADIIGTKSMRAEAELLTMGNEAMKALGFPKYKILLNNRKILNRLAEKIGAEKPAAVFRILDKLDKIGKARVEEEMTALLGKKKTEEFFSSITLDGSNEERIEAAKKIDAEGGSELEQIVSLVDGNIIVDLALVRGLGYYTGPVFEVKASEEIGSVGAGGRYDNLLSLYGAGDCATGISFGIDRLVELLKKGTKEKPYTTVLVAAVKPEFYAKALEVANELRRAGIAAETDLNERNLRKQFDYANALSLPFIAVIGEKEAEEGKVTLRNLKSGKEEMLKLKDAIERIGNE